MVPSVLATVVGATGETLTGVSVLWGPDGEGVTNLCSPHAIDVWACGEEVAGPIFVTATADGHVPLTRSATVGEDECHVITEELSFELQWGED